MKFKGIPESKNPKITVRKLPLMDLDMYIQIKKIYGETDEKRSDS